VITNQTVIARGLATEEDVRHLHDAIQQLLHRANGSQIDAFYVCPHHPNATRANYRIDCACRKPKPGMLLQAAYDHNIDLQRSYMIGDRITDIIAGARAGCKTILIETGAHLEKPIETTEPIDPHIQPDLICQDLSQAVKYILEGA
jgi:D-glycero-D-manno-heptose 1,7-bisphosphate phosphatase